MPKGIVTNVDTFDELVKLSDAYHEPLFYIKKSSLFFVSQDFITKSEMNITRERAIISHMR